jgi:hypothetical protein
LRPISINQPKNATQQNDNYSDNSQRDAGDAAQGFDLAPIQLRVVEQMLQPPIETCCPAAAGVRAGCAVRALTCASCSYVSASRASLCAVV